MIKFELAISDLSDLLNRPPEFLRCRLSQGREGLLPARSSQRNVRFFEKCKPPFVFRPFSPLKYACYELTVVLIVIAVMTNADGKDIVKKSSQRKNRYLLVFNCKLAPAAAGRLGTLAQLDTKNPVMYMEFPDGRLKFFGTLCLTTVLFFCAYQHKLCLK